MYRDMSEMKVLLFGKKGQIGVEIEKQFSSFASLVALDRSSNDFCGDLADLEKIDETIRLVKPTCIINAAAFTSVDDAEKERELAMRINAGAVEVMARRAKQLNALLVHYSTDYIFDGAGEYCRDEDAPPAPINAYGKSKLMGEKHILGSGCRHLIFRTSWVHSVTGQNFIKTIVRLGKQKTKLSVVSDQVGAPTSASLIADVTHKCVKISLTDHKMGGTYNLTALGETNWLEYARLIVSVANKLGVPMKLTPEAITGISSVELKAAASRPLNSRLCTARLERDFGIKLPSWNNDVTDTVTSLLSSRGQI